MTTNVATPAAPAQVSPNADPAAGKSQTPDPALQTPAKVAADAAAAQAAEKAKTDAAAAEKAKADQAAADQAKADEAAKAKKAAEAKFELKLSEGSLLTAERDIAEVTALAKSKGLAPEVGQLLLDQRDTAVKTFVAGQEKIVGDMRAQWKAENAKRHGEKYAAAEAEVKALVEKHGPAGLWDKLNSFGLEPDVFQLLAGIAAQGRDDKFVSGGTVMTDDLNAIADPRQRLAEIHRREMAAARK